MKNNYRIEDGVVYIEIISKGVTHEMLIDEDDLERVSELDRSFSLTNGYAKFMVNRKSIRFHRFILNPPEGKMIDHINGNKLDNRKANLRAVTNQENCNNPNNKRKVSKSGIRGVYYDNDKKSKCWKVEMKSKYHGHYATLEEASEVANKLFKELKIQFEKEV